jgi:hypothetical protein
MIEPQHDEHSLPIFSAALAFAANGCSVVPARVDGSKAPIGAWKKYQTERANAHQIHQWFKDPEQTGLGIITGAASGNLEMLEFEGRAVAMKLLEEAADLAINSGLGHIWEKVTTGYAEFTPSGGLHFYYRISDAAVPGNTKIARMPGEDGGVLIETRGEGGFSITAPSCGSVHPSSKPWVALSGSPATIPSLTWDERQAIHTVLKALDRTPTPETIIEVIAPKAEGGGLTPGDDFNARTTWSELLTPRGWTQVFSVANTTYWRRAGKSIGISATTGRNDGDNLYVFSTSTEFEAEKPYSKFAAFTHLEHGGDFKAAARHLRANGFGIPSIAPTASVSVSASVDSFPILESASPIMDSTPEMPPVKFLTIEEAAYNEELMRARIRRQVKSELDKVDAEKLYDGFIYVETLAEELEMPVVEVPWTIEGIFPKGANVTLTAQYKAGKTTLINNLAKSLADGTRFLNYFKAPEHEGRVVIFNYEVSDNQYRRWMKDVAIERSEMVTLVHLRGKSVPLKSNYVQNEVIELLQTLNATTWIVDPFARAFTGSGDENSNSDVSVFLDMLDIIKEKAGVSNLVLPVHTGRAQEFGIDRARGATRIDDWADVRWLLKKTDDGRFFSADGRDVMLEEQMLRYDQSTRSLTLGGSDARSARKANLEELWVTAVLEHPGSTTTALCTALGKRYDDKALKAARDTAVRAKRVEFRSMGRSDTWYAFGKAPVQYDLVAGGGE